MHYHWWHPNFSGARVMHSPERCKIRVRWGSGWHMMKVADLLYHCLKFAVSRVPSNTWWLPGMTAVTGLLCLCLCLTAECDLLFLTQMCYSSRLSSQSRLLWYIVYGVKPCSVWKLKLVWYHKTDLSGTASCLDYSAPELIHLSWLSRFLDGD